jgi:hypothetical protein
LEADVTTPAPDAEGARARPDRDRDRETVRRALRAGGLTWAVVGGLLVASVLYAGGDGRAGLAAVLLGMVFGGMVASGWLLVAAGLDLLADEPPSRRRAAWTVAVVVATMLSPVLVLGAGG